MGKYYKLGPNKSFAIKSQVDQGTSIGFIIDIAENKSNGDQEIQPLFEAWFNDEIYNNLG